MTLKHSTIITAILIASPAFASDFIVDGSETNTNGGETLNGDDSILITESGRIETSGNFVHGIEVDGGNNTATVNGRIETSGDYAGGIEVDGNNNTATVNGRIETSGNLAYGIAVNDDNNTATVNGSIVTSGNYADGIQLFADNNTATVNGSIVTSGEEAYGIMVDGDNNTATLVGKIAATGTDAGAVYLNNGTGNRFILKESARIVGPLKIQGNSASDTQGTLVFDLGAAQSYTFETTTHLSNPVNDWDLEDLDDRPVVQGSAVAAGISHAETADELQSLRLGQIDSALSGPLSRFDLKDGERQVWVDPYLVQSKRSHDSSNPQQTAYDGDGIGLTLGMPVSLGGYDTTALFAVQSFELDIENGIQTIDNTRVSAGLAAHSLVQLKGVDVSARALLGLNQTDMTRQVLVNTNTTTGETTDSSDYDSVDVTLGVSGRYAQAINQQTTGFVRGALDIVHERIDGFEESVLQAKWDSRNLTQAFVGVSGGIDYSPKTDWTLSAQTDVKAREVVSGENASFQLAGQAVEFQARESADLTLGLTVGASYKPTEGVEVSLRAAHSQSDSDVDTQSVVARVNWRF